MIKRKRFIFNILLVLAVLLFIGIIESFSLQTKEKSLHIVPENEKYLYSIGENVLMNISLNSPTGIKKIEVSYKITRNGVQTIREGKVNLIDGKGVVTGTLGQPGFLRCEVTCIVGNDTLQAVCGCGFNVEEIHAKGKLPANFKRFWDEAKVELVRIPIDAQLEEVEVVGPGDAKRFKVSLANVNGTRVFGWLHLPKGDGPFPTILSIPGSGVGRTGRFAGFPEAGFAVFAIEVHGLKPGKSEIIGGVQWVTPVNDVIRNFVKLQNGILKDYHSLGKEDPYRYYHRRSLQGAIRAIDYLCTRADVDTGKIFVFGGSQGGGLSLLTAAIDKRIKAVVATVPGFCDNTDRLPGDAGRSDILTDRQKQQFINTMLNYDAALASELIDVPTLIGVGFIDDICRPANVYSAYNMLRGQKKIENFYNMGHGSPSYWREQTIEWFKNIK